MNSVIRTEKLSKHYGKLKAVDKVSINVERGQIYGFLGLNGAGKTTTIRMLLGLIGPTSGEAFLNDVKVSAGKPRMWEKIGYLVEVPYSYPDLTVRENLELIRRLRFLKDRESVDKIIDLLKLNHYSDIKAKNLSLGNAQRLGLAKALIHQPEILILDEPANGLDPEGIVEIREFLEDLARNKGVTVFISSHILGEISKLATRIGIIHEGRLIHESSVKDMEELRNQCLRVKVTNRSGAKNVLANNGYTLAETESGILEITGNEPINNPDKVAGLLVSSGFPPLMLVVEEEDLETFFLRMIRIKGGAV